MDSISKKAVGILRKLAMNVHLQHEKAYSWWKWKECKTAAVGPMSHVEREFYLKFRPTLGGDDLVVYDIGASVGVVSVCLAKLPNVKAIHAFEPIPASFEALSKLVGGCPQVQCHQVALSDEAGIRTMCLSRSADSSSLLPLTDLGLAEFPGTETDNRIQVRVTRLDDYVRELSLPQPNLIKIDVQGFEDRVLRGGPITIRKAKYCVIEMSMLPLYEGSPLFDDIYKTMRGMGFQLIGFAGDLKGISGRQLQADGIFVNEDASCPLGS